MEENCNNMKNNTAWRGVIII